MSIVFYGCISLDGYLSGKNHSLDWLYNTGSSEETNYEKFYNSMDIIIMGRNTFNEVSSMNSFKEVYPTTENYVFTNSEIDVEGAIKVSGDVVEFVNNIEKDKNIWIVGGGGILNSLLEKDMIDRMYIQIAPVIIGDGIKLFTNGIVEKRFALYDVKKYGEFAELIYDRIK